MRSSSEKLRILAEQIMDSIIVSTHETVHSNDKMTKDIHAVTQQSGAEVGELRGKIDEILQHQQSFQAALDAISGKNSLLSFLMEYLSKFRATISSRRYAILTQFRKTRTTWGSGVPNDLSACPRPSDAGVS